DVDIRRHFGLDKYDSEVIPFWKTETIEAMDAFLYRDGYDKKAGECVSLSTLYAAAAFVVCGIPLEDIFMVLTPLHSQNYIDLNDGVITNNRRVVTKPMWFNGTEISTKAQRALRNEQITVVSHCSGYVHCMYDKATIDSGQYDRLKSRLGEYLNAQLDILIFSNFLRANGRYQKHFQFCRDHRGQKRFVKADVLYSYEHGSRFRIADDTYDQLLDEVSQEDFSIYKDADRMCCEQLRTFLEYEKIDLQTGSGREKLRDYLAPLIADIDVFLDELIDFLHIDPKLPAGEKSFSPSQPISLDVDMTRQQVIETLQGIRQTSTVADLAFYAYRDMGTCDWRPYIKASIERNPVSIEMAKEMDHQQVYSWLGGMVNESIYDGRRLSQPDEVCNFHRGDGLEKAITMANILLADNCETDIQILVDQHDIVVKNNANNWRFVSSKQLSKQIIITNNCQIDISEN
ncbi:MAG: hypothetical protein KAS23_01435, partial [Anaerohalosphaera sp.]|nr:hypothetical protein [Anaerohalosphaera sp.]